MVAKRARRPRRENRSEKPARRTPSRGGFVGRDASPVLDKYPPKDPSLAPRGPPPAPSPAVAIGPPRSAPNTAPPPAPSSPATPVPLITLEKAFDIDSFSTLLGETSVRVTVPREDLPEVLRRVTDFMGFGIYVYAVTVRPAPAELLKAFVVELRRVEYSAEKGAWVPFVEQGVRDSPYSSGTSPP